MIGVDFQNLRPGETFPNSHLDLMGDPIHMLCESVYSDPNGTGLSTFPVASAMVDFDELGAVIR
jgi:hypothetical protein